MSSDEDNIKGQVVALLQQEQELKDTEAQLMANKAFSDFIAKQKEFKEKSDILWGTIQQNMIAHNIKSVKGDWGSVTVAEKPVYKVVDMSKLDMKFIKETADLKKIGQSHKLEGEAPAGVSVEVTKYLVRRFK